MQHAVMKRVFCDVSECLLGPVAFLLPTGHKIAGSAESDQYGVVRLAIDVPQGLWPHKTERAQLEIVEPDDGGTRLIRLVPILA